MRQTSIIMEAVEAKPRTWKAEGKTGGKTGGKTEKLSLLVLGICIAALVTILVVRPF